MGPGGCFVAVGTWAEQVRLGDGRPGNVLGLLWWTFKQPRLSTPLPDSRRVGGVEGEGDVG